MPRFYISDGNAPGVRCPAGEYATKSGRTSDVLNEAQAIARGRKLVPTEAAAVVGFDRFRFTFAGGPKAQFGFIATYGGIAAFAAPNAAGTNLIDSLFVSESRGANWLNVPVSPSLFQASHASLSPYSYTPTWLAVQLSAPIQPGSFRFVEYTGEAGSWRFTPGNVTIEGSNDGVSWSAIKTITPADFTAGIGAVTGNGTAYTINV
jgi:hypothetical protein